MRVALDDVRQQLATTNEPPTTDRAIWTERLAERVVRDARSSEIIGCTSYHDIVTDIDRVEIGYTWYAMRAQRTHVNTACKLVLLTHAFESLGCAVVGWRTDILNVVSQLGE